MNIQVICSDNMKRILNEILQLRDIIISKEADVILIEKGYELPEGKLAIVFDYNTIGNLIDILESVSKEENVKSTMIGKTKSGYEIIPYEKVIYFEADGNYTYCITIDGGRYKVREKLYEIEKNLKNKGFSRIGKPFIVNIINVVEIIPWFGGRLLLKLKDSKKELHVARNYVRKFKDLLGI